MRFSAPTVPKLYSRRVLYPSDLPPHQNGVAVASSCVPPPVICLPSETVTLVLADCLFVESLFQDGFTYESVAKRRIYPLFQAMFGPAPDLAALPVKSLIRGSALYGV